MRRSDGLTAVGIWSPEDTDWKLATWRQGVQEASQLLTFNECTMEKLRIITQGDFPQISEVLLGHLSESRQIKYTDEVK
jgi:hypothetical protein